MRFSGIGYLVGSPSYRTTCLCQKKSIGEQQLNFLAVSPVNIAEVELVHQRFGEV